MEASNAHSYICLKNCIEQGDSVGQILKKWKHWSSKEDEMEIEYNAIKR